MKRRFPGYTFTINFPVLLRIIGLLLLIESVFLLVPLVTCLIYGEDDWEVFLITLLITAGIGFALTLIRPSSSHMAKREGFLLTALVWVVFSLFGMLPFMFMKDQPLDISSAFFEAMSGFTTTGASIMSSIAHLSHGVIIWRSLMQWIGGMGIILFTLAIIPMLNHSGGMQMFNAEVTGITHDKLRPRISQTAKGLWMIYISLTVILFVLLIIGPMDVFEALNHAFSTMSTGGFSTSDDSIQAWDSVYVESLATIFMFLSGTSFVLLYRALHGDFKPIWQNDVFRAYVRIIAVCYVLFVISIVVNGGVKGVKSLTLDPLFQVVSTITSTGYMVKDFEDWGTFVIAILVVLMFIGACAGSTSGGAKIDRMLFLIKNLHNEIVRCVHPNNIYTVRVNGSVIPHELVSKVIAFLCLYVVIILVGGIALTAMGMPLVDAFFSTFSCISNTGLGTTITGYGGSYDMVPDLGKWVLSLVMMTGRLEIFTVLLLFTSSFWHK